MGKICQLFKAQIIVLDLCKTGVGHLFIAAKMIEPRELTTVDIRILVELLALKGHKFRIINHVRVVKEPDQFLLSSDIKEVFHAFQIARSLVTVNLTPTLSSAVM